MSPEKQSYRARGGLPKVAKAGRFHDLWGRFWAIPVACTVGAIVLGAALPHVEERLGRNIPYVFQGGPDGARGLLSTIATGMISMTGLVFSITMVVLQLASSQFSPRVLGGFLENRITQVTLGVFIASFTFALTVTRYVRGGSDGSGAFVPQVSVTFAFLLVLASVACFLAFINHITTTIQVTHVVSGIGERTCKLIDTIYPDDNSEDAVTTTGPTWSPSPDTRLVDVTASGHGHIVSVDYDQLVQIATDHDAVVALRRSAGSFVLEDQDLFRVWGPAELDDRARKRLASSVTLMSERQLRQDVAFGLRQLVDIAERALSPGINDPTTAVECINEMHRILRHLAQRERPSPYIADESGTVRVIHAPQAFEDLLALVVSEVSHYGRDSLRVRPRLGAMLDDLDSVAAPHHRSAVERARELLNDAAREEQ